MDFSAINRAELIRKLQAETFDLLVLGGGITGAGIALDATARGLKTALVEKDDFASGTSSRSTKLIHGGLRYLKQLEFGLVKEVGSERAIVHRLAPHLVLPEKMLLPLYEKRGFGSLLTSYGLKLYDWLAGVQPEDQRRMLTRKQTLKAEPYLNPSEIKGGALYAEYRTDDARLTIEIIKAGFLRGALPVSYLQVTGLIYKEGAVAGATVVDRVSNQSFNISARVVVNACGPWVDEIREMNQSKSGKSLHLTKGVHIVVAREKLPVTQSIYFDVGDGRMIFAIPRGRTTYIGTTDTNYTGNKDAVFASNEDVAYLLKAVNSTFQNIHLTTNDIESSWAGLRPLIHEDGKSASELSRKDEIFESPTGLISIAGGKLTGYRKMAERVVDLVVDQYFDQSRYNSCVTEKILLTTPGFASAKEVNEFVAATARELRVWGGDEKMAYYLVTTYGKQTTQLFQLIDRSMDDFDLAVLKAEVAFAVGKEMAVYPLDFLVRRTGMLFFDIHRLEKYYTQVVEEFAILHGWPEEEKRREEEKIKDYLQRTRSFKT